ncbi:hypothetical protein DPMN_162209 [Dreissena polymorpha]|uniref:Uncharacterized protein n=1 Tax=Dreissena polymorpha TaxID=45954 RepID=A0A9D4EQ60_DREPO|nr:hypothetical protein DPMN_162209 [Dreissena polymorpha]
MVTIMFLVRGVFSEVSLVLTKTPQTVTEVTAERRGLIEERGGRTADHDGGLF